MQIKLTTTDKVIKLLQRGAEYYRTGDLYHGGKSYRCTVNKLKRALEVLEADYIIVRDGSSSDKTVAKEQVALRDASWIFEGYDVDGNGNLNKKL